MKPPTHQRQPIRVLHPITRLIVGGAQENTMYTAALLDKQRFHVEVLSGPQTGSEGSLIEEVRQRGIPLTIFPDLLRQVSPWHDLKALWKMKRFIQTGGYTIVHTHSSKAGIIGRLAARLAKTPLIVHTVHGWSFHDYMSPVTRWVYIVLERWIARFSDVLVVVTERDIEKGLQAGIGRREQYRRIRSAIPLDEFDPRMFDRQTDRQELGLPAETVVIGNVGRFSAQKNPLDWVRVAEKVGQACPQARFLLVGDGPLRPQVEQALLQAGISRADYPDRLAPGCGAYASSDGHLLADFFVGRAAACDPTGYGDGLASGSKPDGWCDRGHPGRQQRLSLLAGGDRADGRMLHRAGTQSAQTPGDGIPGTGSGIE